MSADTDSTIASLVADHPRFMGVMFAAALLLTTAGSAAAEIGYTVAGP